MTTVLIIEDSEPLGRMLTQTLARAGHDAHWAATGADAIEQVAASTPEVAFVDLHLGDTGGIELAIQLRAAVPGCRVIGLSGEAPGSDIVQQFDAFLLKPVALDALLAVVTGQ